MSTSFRWTFTVHNLDGWEPRWNDITMLYMVWQLEVAPETGAIHCQGYVRFKAKKRMQTVKNELGRDDAHVEHARGSEEQNREYCTKDASRKPGEIPHEFGAYDKDAGKQGKRNDLEEIAAECRAGKTIKAIAEAHPGDFIRYHQGIQSLHELIGPAPPAVKELFVLIMWGPTGTGKTWRARTKWPSSFICLPGRDPWSGYIDQETVIMDEFQPSDWNPQKLNMILDHYTFNLDMRYHNRCAVFRRIVICTNISPQNWYAELSYTQHLVLEAVLRRIRGCCRYVDKREDEGGPSIEQIIEAPADPF